MSSTNVYKDVMYMSYVYKDVMYMSYVYKDVMYISYLYNNVMYMSYVYKEGREYIVYTVHVLCVQGCHVCWYRERGSRN